MKKNEVEIGNEYVVKVSGRLVSVKILRESPYGGWIGRNKETGRDVRVRTAARLRYPANRADRAMYAGAVRERVGFAEV